MIYSQIITQNTLTVLCHANCVNIFPVYHELIFSLSLSSEGKTGDLIDQAVKQGANQKRRAVEPHQGKRYLLFISLARLIT